MFVFRKKSGCQKNTNAGTGDMFIGPLRIQNKTKQINNKFGSILPYNILLSDRSVVKAVYEKNRQ